MNIFNSKVWLLLTVAFLSAGIQAMEQPAKKYISQVVITGGENLYDMPDRVHILPFTSTDPEAPKKTRVEEAPGVTLNGIFDVAEKNMWKPGTEFRFKLNNPVLINVDAQNPELEIAYGCAVMDEPVRHYFMADAINAAGPYNVLFINLDNEEDGMRLEPVIKGG